MEYILGVLKAGMMLAFLCSVHIKTLSMNEKHVPDSYCLKKFSNSCQPQLTQIMHSADYNALLHLFLLTT